MWDDLRKSFLFNSRSAHGQTTVAAGPRQHGEDEPNLVQKGEACSASEVCHRKDGCATVEATHVVFQPCRASMLANGFRRNSPTHPMPGGDGDSNPATQISLYRSSRTSAQAAKDCSRPTVCEVAVLIRKTLRECLNDGTLATFEAAVPRPKANGER